jgi:crossover junction endodeoxyribonuclease RuvC
MTYTIGIDPGINGAIALLDTDGTLVDVYDMQCAGGAVSAQLLAAAENWADHTTYGTVIIEDVASMPGQGVSSTFKFGRSKGVVEGVFAALGRPIVYITPAKWKRDLRLTKDKGACRQRAVELWPHKAALFARVKDDGRAEAALIAHWYQTNNRREVAA